MHDSCLDQYRMTKSQVKFKTARELFNFECTSSSALHSGCTELDNLIGGGFFPGCVTEISGEAGCGKSQICMQFAAVTIAEGRKVVCIETERGFSVKRVREILKLHTNEVDEAMQRLLISSPSTMEQMMNILGKLEHSTQQLDETSVVIVDAIATFFRGCTEKEDFQKWRNVLTMLYNIALHHNIAVIYVNHITTRPDSSSGEWTTTPFLAKGSSRRPTIQLWLDRSTTESGTIRRISVVKSPFSPTCSAEYVITNSGLSFVRLPSN
ncbi:unnamed protein product [Cylicocyclus nassatus]|uniref:RecA family profile 1 domain-containing protein n=1 Tax=Cylicocyclus nassatus TaxID=53992 RepID=A0AA36GU48_CYLNA|nr:unnamed protein product [Cylicocyclus nassatus]